ncbi:hypothetical protein EMCRGX_G007822 [Ephydatia muelleri]
MYTGINQRPVEQHISLLKKIQRWLKKSGKIFLMTLKERRSRKHIHPPSSQLLPPPALASPPAAALPRQR